MSGEAPGADPVTRNDLEKLALGRLRLTRSEFLHYTPREFFNCVAGFAAEKQEAEERELRRYRWLGAIIINRGVKKQHQIKPEDLISLPGDKEQTDKVEYTADICKQITEHYNKTTARNKANN